MGRIQIGIIGTGWIGGIRAQTCAAHPLVEAVHLAEIDEARLDAVAKQTGARTATTDYLSAERHAPVTLPLDS